MYEPDITINGSRLTTAQAMTVRVALGAFALHLRTEGLGEDTHGTHMTDAYLVRIKEIFQHIRDGS